MSYHYYNESMDRDHTACGVNLNTLLKGEVRNDLREVLCLACLRKLAAETVQRRKVMEALKQEPPSGDLKVPEGFTDAKVTVSWPMVDITCHQGAGITPYFGGIKATWEDLANQPVEEGRTVKWNKEQTKHLRERLAQAKQKEMAAFCPVCKSNTTVHQPWCPNRD